MRLEVILLAAFVGAATAQEATRSADPPPASASRVLEDLDGGHR